jgi:L-phenylalanine/L-methionine N-acetyltransferase
LPIDGLKIRRAEPDDCSALYDIFTSPDVFSDTLQLPHPSRELWRQRLTETDSGIYNLVAVVDDRVVGMLSVETFPKRPRRRHAGRIGISVDGEWQGKGIGAALMRAGLDLSDNWLNLTRLELEVYTDNEAAIRLYEKFGFSHEGIMRQHAFRDGQYVDSAMMARLRPAKSSIDES